METPVVANPLWSSSKRAKLIFGAHAAGRENNRFVMAVTRAQTSNLCHLQQTKQSSIFYANVNTAEKNRFVMEVTNFYYKKIHS